MEWCFWESWEIPIMMFCNLASALCEPDGVCKSRGKASALVSHILPSSPPLVFHHNLLLSPFRILLAGWCCWGRREMASCCRNPKASPVLVAHRIFNLTLPQSSLQLVGLGLCCPRNRHFLSPIRNSSRLPPVALEPDGGAACPGTSPISVSHHNIFTIPYVAWEPDACVGSARSASAPRGFFLM